MAAIVQCAYSKNENWKKQTLNLGLEDSYIKTISQIEAKDLLS